MSKSKELSPSAKQAQQAAESVLRNFSNEQLKVIEQISASIKKSATDEALAMEKGAKWKSILEHPLPDYEKMSASYLAALTRLQEQHSDDFNDLRQSFDSKLAETNDTFSKQVDALEKLSNSAKQQADSTEKFAQSTDSRLAAVNKSLREQVAIARAEAASAKKDAFWSKVFSVLSILAAIVIPLIIAA